MAFNLSPPLSSLCVFSACPVIYRAITPQTAIWGPCKYSLHPQTFLLLLLLPAFPLSLSLSPTALCHVTAHGPNHAICSQVRSGRRGAIARRRRSARKIWCQHFCAMCSPLLPPRLLPCLQERSSPTWGCLCLSPGSRFMTEYCVFYTFTEE